jgi:hypothetical protein
MVACCFLFPGPVFVDCGVGGKWDFSGQLLGGLLLKLCCTTFAAILRLLVARPVKAWPVASRIKGALVLAPLRLKAI